jgi:hypothetical protein
MAQVDRITFKATTQLIYPDNNTGEISPADIRAQMDDIADSTPFKTTTKTAAPTALDSGYEIGDIWVDFNADFVYLCINNTPGEAIWQNISVPAISNSEIKAAYEANADTNAFDDAAVAKLAGIETAATADQTGAEIEAALDAELGSTDWKTGGAAPTGAEIKTAYEAEADTNAFTDAEQTKLAGIETAATADQTGAEIEAALDAELGSTDWKTGGAAPTDAEIKTAYENNADTNAFTDAQVTKLAGIETSATADQTGAEIEAALDTQIGSTVWRTPTSVITVSTSRALALTDANDLLEVDTSGGAVDITIPLNATVAFPIGTVINFTIVDATAAGTVTSVSGVTLNDADNDTITLGPVYDGVSIYKAGTDSWRVTAGATGTEIKALYEAEADTNAFDDAAVTKLAGIETAATADQTGAEIVTAIDGELGTIWKGAMTQTELTASHVVVDADLAGNVVRRLNNAAAMTVTVNTGLTGTEVATWIQTGAGQVTFVQGAGVTLLSADGLLATRAQYSSVSLIPDATTANTYYIVGDLA